MIKSTRLHLTRLYDVSGIFDFDATPLVGLRDCVLRLGTMTHVFAITDNGSINFCAVDGSKLIRWLKTLKVKVERHKKNLGNIVTTVENGDLCQSGQQICLLKLQCFERRCREEQVTRKSKHFLANIIASPFALISAR